MSTATLFKEAGTGVEGGVDGGTVDAWMFDTSSRGISNEGETRTVD
jgi:hypothetical protein